MALRAATVFAAVLASRIVLALGETNATCDDGQLSCTVCEDEFRAVASLNVRRRSSSSASAALLRACARSARTPQRLCALHTQVLSNLPRINARGDPVNRTLGEFDFVVCNDPDRRANTSNLTGCPLSSLAFNLDVLQANALGNAQSPSPAAYFQVRGTLPTSPPHRTDERRRSSFVLNLLGAAQSVGMYVLAMFVCGAFIVVYGLLLALCRFGTDRCCGPLRCATLRLGLDAPTKRECCIGFRKDSKGDFAYPLWEVIFAYGLLVAFIISTMYAREAQRDARLRLAPRSNLSLPYARPQALHGPVPGERKCGPLDDPPAAHLRAPGASEKGALPPGSSRHAPSRHLGRRLRFPSLSQGLALLVHNASLEPADNFAEKIAGDVTAEFLLELEDVVSRSMSLANATTNTVCAIWSIERQPDVSITQTSVAAMEAHQLELRRLLHVAEVEQLGVTPRKDAVRAAIDNLTATVDILVDAKPTMDDKLAFILPAIGEVANLQSASLAMCGSRSIAPPCRTFAPPRSFAPTPFSCPLRLAALIQATGPSPARAVTRRFFDLVEVFDRWFPRSNHVPYIRARLERVIAGDVDGEEAVNRTVRNDLLNAMDNMIRDYEALPSLYEMADTMQEFNDLVLTSFESGVFRNVTDRIQAVHDYTESLPLPDEVMVVIQHTLGIGRAMDEGPALRSATAVRDSVRALPSFDALRADVHRVPLVFEGLPCLFEVVRQAVRMNETVIRVPLPISSLVPLSQALNDTLASLNRNISAFDAALDVAEANVLALPIDALIADTQAWRADLTRNFLNLEVDRLQAEEIAFDQRRFFTPRVLRQYDEFRDTLNASLVPDSFIAFVRAYEASRRAFTEFLRTETRRVRWYHGGTCYQPNAANPTNICFTNSGSEIVGANSTCPSECKNIGTRRCETDLSIACPSNATVCPTGECIVDDTRLRLLIAAMEQMQSDRPVFQPIVRMFNSSINESTFPTQDLVDEVNDARRKFAAISGESFNQQLALSYRGLDVLDEFAGRQALITAREQIEPVPFPDLRRAVDEARAVELDQDAVQEPKLLLVRNFFDALWYFFKDEVPRLVRVLRFVATTPAADAVETLVEVFQTFDFATRFLATRSEYLAETIEPTTTEANMGELLSRLSFAQSRHHIDLGPYYFLVRVLANSSRWISHADTLAHRYGFDITEAAYPGDRACITQECLDREVEYYNTWELRRASSGAVDLAISREALFGLPLLAPAILLAVTVYALVGDRFIKEPERRHIPASVFVGTTMACAPFFFAVSGLLFGGTLIFADVCYSGEAAALRVLDVLGDTLCPDVVGGEGGYEHCIVRMNATEAFPLEVDLPLSELFRAAAGLCEGGRHPTETVLHSLGASMRHSPELYIRRALLDVFGDGSDTSFDLREPVRVRGVEEQAALVRSFVLSFVRPQHPMAHSLPRRRCLYVPETGPARSWSS